MARIYIARTTGIGAFERHVVLKMILPERASDKHSVDMFLDEARLAAALNHQNVAQVFEVGQESGVHYLAMEYVHGQDLRAVLSKAGHTGARIPIELSLAIVAGAAAGLHHAHDRKSPDGVPLGIVHRDVSPSNIMIGYDGAVKLLDFGIAKATARSHETQSGIIKGKFAYMSPEQCRGREVDRRSDVFSLGIILYEITTQHRCFRADSDFDTMHRIVTGDVVRPSRLIATYPAELEKIVMMALAVDPARRYASASALLEELESFASYSRLSPSTMALGRFMRELFGEIPEPWLVEGGRLGQASPPRESTVSNTMDSQARFGGDRNAASSEPSHQIQLGDAVLDYDADVGAPNDTWPPKEPSRSGNTWAAKPSSRARSGLPAGATPSSMNAASSSPPKAGAGQTLLDLPRSGQEAEDAVDWDAKAYPQAQPTFASQLEVASERKASIHGHEPSTVAPALRSASGSGALRSTGPRRAFSVAPNAQPQPPGPQLPQPLSTSQPMSSLAASAASVTGGSRSATSQPLSMPQLAPLSSDNKTSTASALAALPLGSSSFSTLEVSAEKKLRAESMAADLRPQRRLLVVVMVMILVVAFAALLLIALGGGDVDSISPRVDPQTTNPTATNPTGTTPPTGTAGTDNVPSNAGSTGGETVPTVPATPPTPSTTDEAGADSATGAGAGSAEGGAGRVTPTEAGGGNAGGAGSAGAATIKPPATGTTGTDAPSTEGDRTVPPSVTMHLQVTSDPKGADVYLNNKRLGVTPLSVYLPKRSGSATLSVRRQRFIEASAKIDLASGEVSKSFSLRRAPERTRERTEDGEPKEPKSCQRPDSANPFDDTPICE